MRKNQIIILSFAFLIYFIFSPAQAEEKINLTLRNGEEIIFSGEMSLSPDGTKEVSDSSGNTHSINSNSVLSLLLDADSSSENFNISNLEYYSSFGSFYLKCITYSSGEKCDNWQYALRGSTPGTGMDKDILTGGEHVYIYFGLNHRVTLEKKEITENETIRVKAERYNYEENTWLPLTLTIGVTRPDPENPYSPIEILTAPADENGESIFSNIPTGNYGVGIKEDYYFPLENLTVTSAPRPTNTRGMSVMLEKKKFDLGKAAEFLISNQKSDGSFENEMYTDWTAIALSSIENLSGQKKELLTNYLTNSSTENFRLTDHLRKIMALLSFDINPYETYGNNYIKKVLSFFDGKEWGEKDLDNDDIFALIVLKNLGYKEEDEIMKNTLQYILSRQKINGSWDESVDMTGAGILAISAFTNDENAKLSIEKAKKYLKYSQNDNGGWGNVSSTAWALQGILSLGEKPEDWDINNNDPLDYLAINQGEDGGTKEDDIGKKIWTTSYALSALSGKNWSDTMARFERPIEVTEPEIAQENEKIEETIQSNQISLPVKEIKNVTEKKNINVSEKKKTQEIRIKPIKETPPEKVIEQSASVINAFENSIQNEARTEEKSWWSKFLEKILYFIF